MPRTMPRSAPKYLSHRTGQARRSEFGTHFTLAFARAHGHSVEQRASARDLEQFRQFDFRQRTTLAAAIGVFVRLGHPFEWIARNSLVLTHQLQKAVNAS